MALRQPARARRHESLTAREALTVLGSRGVRADVLFSSQLTIARLSRWRERFIPAPPPGSDPLGMNKPAELAGLAPASLPGAHPVRVAEGGGPELELRVQAERAGAIHQVE